MSNASGAFGQLAYIKETTYNQIPTVGNPTRLRMTSPTPKAQAQYTKSQEIRPDRLSAGQILTDLSVDGGFNFELSAKEYDPFIEAAVCGQFSFYGTNGLGTTFSATITATTITASAAPTGTSQFTNIAVGSWFKVVPPAAATSAEKKYWANKWFKCSARTTTIITVDASTPIAAPGIVTAVAGYAISQAVATNGTYYPSFTLEHSLTDISQFFTYTGMRLNQFDVSMEVGSIISGTASFMGSGHPAAQNTTRLPGTLQASQTYDPMNSVDDLGVLYEGGSSLINGSSSFIKSCKFTLNNNARGQKALGVLGNTDVKFGMFDITGNLEMYVEDAAYYNKWLSGSTTNLAVGMADKAGNGYLVEFHKIRFTDGGLNPGGNSEDVMLSLPFEAEYDPVTGKGIRITRALSA